MPSDSSENASKWNQWSQDLACPVCFGQLRFDNASVVCVSCGRTYPVVDDIPVLIPQRAAKPGN